MKRFMMMLMLALFSVLLIAPDADARRMGGRSMGKQSDLMKRDAARPPAQAGQQAGKAPAAGAAAAPAGRSWMGPIAGIAAGLGLAALASYLGLGAEFANLMLIALLAIAGLFAFRFFMARRNGANAGAALGGGPRTAYAGAGAGQGNGAFRQQSSPSQPWAGAAGGGAASAAAAAQSATVPASVQNPDVPANFDTDRFVHAAKVNFVRLQTAFDSKRADDLREFTSPEMFAELNLDLMQRGTEQQVTDVVTLDARLLGVERTGANDETELASVRFEGMLREGTDAAATPFVEVWNFTRPADQSAGWVLAGIQQVD